MSEPRWSFLQTFPIPDDGLDMIRAAGTLVQRLMPDSETLMAAISGADAILAGSEPITDEVMANAPRLKVIGRFGVGVDSVDIAAATRRGIPVLNTPAVNAQTVAEHAITLMAGLARRMGFSDKAIRESTFKLRGSIMGTELHGKTLGVVGLGQIGKRVARAGVLGFGMRLLVTTAHPDPKRLEDLGVDGEFVGIDDLLRRSDVVTLHCLVNAATQGLLSAERIGLMKRGAYLVNTSRGALVDEQALIAALREGRLGGAGLDVFAVEPPDPSNPLLKMDNTLLSPHVSSNSVEAFSRMGVMICSAVLDYLRGGHPPNCVNPEVYARRG